MPRQYYVYIAANKRNAVLYTGVTNSLGRRMFEHRNRLASGFTAKYRVTKLVYYETFVTAGEAIAAEKKIKAGSRRKKVALIEGMNPDWRDLLAP